jgi:hypothetical protein
MDNTPRAGRKLEGILKETLYEISQGKFDLFHRVVADVLDEIAASPERIDSKPTKARNESG